MTYSPKRYSKARIPISRGKIAVQMLCKTLTPPVHRNASPAQQLLVAALLSFAIAVQIAPPPVAYRVGGQVAGNLAVNFLLGKYRLMAKKPVDG